MMGIVFGLEYIFFSPKIEGLPFAAPFEPLLLLILMLGKQSSVIGSVGGYEGTAFSTRSGEILPIDGDYLNDVY
jgi:hypothetical protein